MANKVVSYALYQVSRESIAIAMLVPNLNQQYMKPGSKLICINDQFDESAKLCLSVFPRKGVVYTVTEIIPDPLRELPPGLVLEGLTNPMGQVPCRNGLVLIQYSFRADRFVPQAKKEEPWGGSFFHLKYPLGIPSIEN